MPGWEQTQVLLAVPESAAAIRQFYWRLLSAVRIQAWWRPVIAARINEVQD